MKHNHRRWDGDFNKDLEENMNYKIKTFSKWYRHPNRLQFKNILCMEKRQTNGTKNAQQETPLKILQEDKQPTINNN